MSRSVVLPLGLFVIGASIAGAQPAPSQSALEEGQPLVRVHRPREVGGGNQTWSFVQDSRGVIYAGTHGYFDKVPVDKVAATEKELLQFMRDEKSEVRSKIVETGKLDDDTEAALKTALDEFRHRLEAAQKTAAA